MEEKTEYTVTTTRPSRRPAIRAGRRLSVQKCLGGRWILAKPMDLQAQVIHLRKSLAEAEALIDKLDKGRGGYGDVD